MGLQENIKNLPQDLADAIRRVKESGEADVTVYKTVVAGLKIVIKIGESDEDLDLEDKTSEELNDLLVELQRRLEIILGDEPDDDESDEYEEWEDEISRLEDMINQVQEALDDLEEQIAIQHLIVRFIGLLTVYY